MPNVIIYRFVKLLITYYFQKLPFREDRICQHIITHTKILDSQRLENNAKQKVMNMIPENCWQ